MSTHHPEPLDQDPLETRDWLDSVDSVVEHRGTERAGYLLGRVFEQSARRGARPELPITSAYVNTIPAHAEPDYPGDAAIERRIRRINRWNAVAMVQKANQRFDGLGGHQASYASSASLYEVGFNHFFRAPSGGAHGDFVYYQGHAIPGIYARAFLEGRLEAEQLDHFRRESGAKPGLSSYPHPRLMPDFWQFPTVSMGIGPLSAIYQARFLRYMHNRGLADTAQSRVWAFLGDGECDEPESLGSLAIATREELDNLVFVINCNLQRLDGPVRGNGKIIQELEGVFRGAGWNVIKVVWGPEWDPILARDTEGLLHKRMLECVDGAFQKVTSGDGAYFREQFFGTDPRLLALVSDLSDKQLQGLRRGGHSYQKIYAAYLAATKTVGRPTCILAHTVKGWTLGQGFEGSYASHQRKKLDEAGLRTFRDLLELPIRDEELKELPYYRPPQGSEELEYLHERRRALGGYLPARRRQASVGLTLPKDDLFSEFLGAAKSEMSTTMVFGRILGKLIGDKQFGKRIVPIIPDEARTFGLEPLFGRVGIFSAKGQLYEPIDKGNVSYYKEMKSGQVLEEGITEAGSMASFTAAATSYSTLGEPMVPFYIFYSMFGFQRTGDQMWACCDSLGRGFVLGATAGRTTLNGEGLQHEDGHSQLLAATYPSVVAYDISFGFELAWIIQDGLRRMYQENENIYYYITLQNENYNMPAAPEGSKEGVLKGIYKYQDTSNRKANHVQLFGGGCIMLQVLRAAEILDTKYGVTSTIYGVTSYQQLRREALECERHNRLHPNATPRVPYITQVLADGKGPVIAASDYMTLVQDQVARWIPTRYVALGTDGFGMSDTREALRRHFEVDAESIVIGALDALRQDGKLDPKRVAAAIAELGVDPDKAYSAHR